MPERDNDKLESFFKKVSGRPDISFSEDDWKRLEARLDARDARSAIARRNRNRIAGATVVAALLLGSLYWLSQSPTEHHPAVIVDNKVTTASESKTSGDNPIASLSQKGSTSNGLEQKQTKGGVVSTESVGVDQKEIRNISVDQNVDRGSEQRGVTSAPSTDEIHIVDKPSQREKTQEWAQSPDAFMPAVISPKDGNDQPTATIDITNSSATAEKIKQKADAADSVVEEKNDVKVIDAYGSGLTERPASPRLSLLLSIAPDFSTVAFDYYSDPGQAFGLMLHYHVKRSWSFSTGVVKTVKKYVGDGEDYTPPKGYWKNNTNGIIPATIDGSCNILEIPVMVQYAIVNKGKSRVLVGAGTSSYIMLNESYTYNFDQPNPGAKSGWTSKRSSSLLFSVIDVTAGFEHRFFPRFMIGVEPYLKIPIEGIGWSDLKLYSAGASLTLRYILINQKKSSATADLSRGPG